MILSSRDVIAELDRSPVMQRELLEILRRCREILRILQNGGDGAEVRRSA